MAIVSSVLINLFLVGVVACLAPFLIYITRAFILPAVVLEIVGGIIIGPQVLNWVHVDVFLGFLSLILAVINLFPFLPLDGGHVLWAVAEKVRGRRISLLAMYRFSSVGIVLLLFLVINGVSNDISRLAG